jgi:hypothetical protein
VILSALPFTHTSGDLFQLFSRDSLSAAPYRALATLSLHGRSGAPAYPTLLTSSMAYAVAVQGAAIPTF